MAVNSDKTHLWKLDIANSVDFYNNWFIRFAPKTYRDARSNTTQQVEFAMKCTKNLTDITPAVLKRNPSILPALRMAAAPPIARDRLIGLAGVKPNLVKNMEVDMRVPPRMNTTIVDAELQKIGQMIIQLADKDICPWLERKRKPNRAEIHRAATIIADRLCGVIADPIIRNAQEKRQLSSIKKWLMKRGYSYVSSSKLKFDQMTPGSFSFRLNVSVNLEGGKQVNIPIDTVVMPINSKPNDFPLLIEAKSAGDFTNVNKRRKEEAMKFTQLKNTHGKDIRFILFLCGYFDSGYLGYEAAEGIDWVWEHRIDDLAKFGV